MLDQLRIALVDKTPRQPIDQSERVIRAPQEQRSGIRAHRPAVKRRHHSAAFYT
jgi:hypothetical protein